MKSLVRRSASAMCCISAINESSERGMHASMEAANFAKGHLRLWMYSPSGLSLDISGKLPAAALVASNEILALI